MIVSLLVLILVTSFWVNNMLLSAIENAGIDAQFLRTATRLAKRAVYSFHKRSTRSFLMNLVEEWGYKVEVAAEMEFDIPQMYGEFIAS